MEVNFRNSEILFDGGDEKLLVPRVYIFLNVEQALSQGDPILEQIIR